jgi:hypothetical protein
MVFTHIPQILKYFCFSFQIFLIHSTSILTKFLASIVHFRSLSLSLQYWGLNLGTCVCWAGAWLFLRQGLFMPEPPWTRILICTSPVARVTGTCHHAQILLVDVVQPDLKPPSCRSLPPEQLVPSCPIVLTILNLSNSIDEKICLKNFSYPFQKPWLKFVNHPSSLSYSERKWSIAELSCLLVSLFIGGSVVWTQGSVTWTTCLAL